MPVYRVTRFPKETDWPGGYTVEHPAREGDKWPRGFGASEDWEGRECSLGYSGYGSTVKEALQACQGAMGMPASEREHCYCCECWHWGGHMCGDLHSYTMETS